MDNMTASGRPRINHRFHTDELFQIVPHEEKQMDYSELKEMSDEQIAEQSEIIRQAHAVIRVLMGRKGFDDWWENIDSDTQDEIFCAMADAIKDEALATIGLQR